MFNHKKHRNSPALSLEAGTVPNKCWLYGVAHVEENNKARQTEDSSKPGFAIPSTVEDLPPPVQAPKPRHGGSTHGLMAELLAAPVINVGHTIETQQRVIQVCIGAEHGILLTDEAIMFTWGDNRYGQIGRDACLTEEDGRPFPVLSMLGFEIIQVAAGKHHCLALSAGGLVWAWGRNKAGQLGCGDFRDRVSPEQVRHTPDDEDHTQQLGSRRGERITSISAAAHTSVAAGFNSMVWQWGEINTVYIEGAHKITHKPAHTSALKMLTATALGSSQKSEPEGMVQTCRPMCVMSKETFRTRMRRNKVAVSDTACQVRQEGQDVERTQDLIDQIRQLREAIELRRQELKRMERKRTKLKERVSKQGPLEEEEQDMGETLALLEAEINANESEIELFKKNLESCDRQQAHHREQLQQIGEQGTDLSEKEDNVSLELVEAKKGTAEWKLLMERLQEVKEYIQANQNSRMTILDRRAQTDKEKQRLSRALDERIRLKAELVHKHTTMKDLSTKATHARETSDEMMRFLSEQYKEFFSHFEGKNEESEFISAMQDLEGDYIFLRNLEQRTQVFVDVAVQAGDPSQGERAQRVNHLLQELLAMRRLWDQLAAIGWLKNDLDLSSFFDRAAKPLKPGQARGSLFAQPALPWAPP